MRKLIYVPIIHIKSDMGTMAEQIDSRSSQICGDARWEKHKKTVKRFWEVIDKYFKNLHDQNLVIYQDGLMADGELGLKIIKEGAAKGSKNYQVILHLIEKGGVIRKTEDIELLKKEYNWIIKLSQAKSFGQKIMAYTGYRIQKNSLLKKRDRFIAKMINTTLKSGETGILFIGTFHDVIPYLDKVIVVEEIKNHEKVKAYFKLLPSKGEDTRFNNLAKHLVSNVYPR